MMNLQAVPLAVSTSRTQAAMSRQTVLGTGFTVDARADERMSVGGALAFWSVSAAALWSLIATVAYWLS